MLKENFTVDNLPNDIMKDIYNYWLDMKGEHSIPSRADLDPADIINLLPYVSLIDVENGGARYRMRLIGTETVRAMNIDLTGKYLDELPLVERFLKRNYDLLVQTKQPYLNFDKLRWSSKSFMDYYALGLPLSGNGREVDMLMFGMYYVFPKEMRTKFYNLGARKTDNNSSQR